MSHSAVPQLSSLYYRHAWINLEGKHITRGRMKPAAVSAQEPGGTSLHGPALPGAWGAWLGARGAAQAQQAHLLLGDWPGEYAVRVLLLQLVDDALQILAVRRTGGHRRLPVSSLHSASLAHLRDVAARRWSLLLSLDGCLAGGSSTVAAGVRQGVCRRTWRSGGAFTGKGDATEGDGAPGRPVLAAPCSEALGVSSPAISGALTASSSRSLFFFRFFLKPPSTAASCWSVVPACIVPPPAPVCSTAPPLAAASASNLFFFFLSFFIFGGPAAADEGPACPQGPLISSLGALRVSLTGSGAPAGAGAAAAGAPAASGAGGTSAAAGAPAAAAVEACCTCCEGGSTLDVIPAKVQLTIVNSWARRVPCGSTWGAQAPHC